MLTTVRLHKAKYSGFLVLLSRHLQRKLLEYQNEINYFLILIQKQLNQIFLLKNP